MARGLLSQVSMNAMSMTLDGSAVAWVPETISATSPRKVLVVDDDERFRSAVIRFLGRSGWSCLGVASGKDACERARDEQFDIALVDCWMPGMSGFETIQALALADPCLPVVMLSAMGTESTRREALKQGAVDYVGKDVPPCEIESIVGREVNQTAVRRRIFDAQENPIGRIARGTILLVDDHDGFRRATARRLKKAGFRVVEAATGAAAIDAGERGGIDGAIIDLHLPDSNGIEVARVLRALKSSITVTIISGEANRQEKAQAATCGLMGCMNKTDGLERLEKVAELLVGQTRRERAEKAEALLPPDPWLTRAGRAFDDLIRHGRRKVRQREARVVVAGLVVSALVAISILNLMTRYEVAHLKTARNDVRQEMSFFEMYDRIAGYLERDEERELNRTQVSGGLTR
jgi:DNA-binding response OmpR family regulator